jgi:hypothetical protein
MDDGTGRYHFKLEDHIDFARYLCTGIGFTITFVYIFYQQRRIKFLLGNDMQVWKELPSPLHPDYETMKDQKAEK